MIRCSKPSYEPKWGPDEKNFRATNIFLTVLADYKVHIVYCLCRLLINHSGCHWTAVILAQRATHAAHSFPVATDQGLAPVGNWLGYCLTFSSCVAECQVLVGLYRGHSWWRMRWPLLLALTAFLMGYLCLGAWVFQTTEGEYEKDTKEFILTSYIEFIGKSDVNLMFS